MKPHAPVRRGESMGILSSNGMRAAWTRLDRAEMNDCFDALIAGDRDHASVTIGHLAMAMERVLGPEQASEKSLKDVFKTMDAMCGRVDRHAFSTFLLKNWPSTAHPTPQGPMDYTSGGDAAVSSAELVRVIRAFRTLTLPERLAKRAQAQLHKAQAHHTDIPTEGKGQAAPSLSGRQAIFSAGRRVLSQGASQLALRLTQSSGQVPLMPPLLVSHRRSSLLLLEAAVTARRQARQALDGSSAPNSTELSRSPSCQCVDRSTSLPDLRLALEGWGHRQQQQAGHPSGSEGHSVADSRPSRLARPAEELKEGLEGLDHSMAQRPGQDCLDGSVSTSPDAAPTLSPSYGTFSQEAGTAAAAEPQQPPAWSLDQPCTDSSCSALRDTAESGAVIYLQTDSACGSRTTSPARPRVPRPPTSVPDRPHSPRWPLSCHASSSSHVVCTKSSLLGMSSDAGAGDSCRSAEGELHDWSCEVGDLCEASDSTSSGAVQGQPCRHLEDALQSSPATDEGATLDRKPSGKHVFGMRITRFLSFNTVHKLISEQSPMCQQPSNAPTTAEQAHDRPASPGGSAFSSHCVGQAQGQWPGAALAQGYGVAPTMNIKPGLPALLMSPAACAKRMAFASKKKVIDIPVNLWRQQQEVEQRERWH